MQAQAMNLRARRQMLVQRPQYSIKRCPRIHHIVDDQQSLILIFYPIVVEYEVFTHIVFVHIVPARFQLHLFSQVT
ncbi:MAG: hypothetical protein CMF73_08645 [Maricaulis sp.]|nr:hypothetical protein [Maricaulis sp.]